MEVFVVLFSACIFAVAFHHYAWIWGNIFVVQVQFCQLLSILIEVHEVLYTLHDRNTRQRLLQVSGKALAIVLRMQQAIDIVEYHFFGDFSCSVTAAHLFQNPVCDAISADIVLSRFLIKERLLAILVFFVPIEGEKLTIKLCLIIWILVCYNS